MSEDYSASIAALSELCGWLGDHPMRGMVEPLVEQLRAAPLTDFQKRQLRHKLSHELLFHPKCLGDCCIKDFPDDGSHYPWWNYLSKICDICQNDLA